MNLSKPDFEKLCRAAYAVRRIATRPGTPDLAQADLLQAASEITGVLAFAYAQDLPAWFLDTQPVPGLLVVEHEA